MFKFATVAALVAAVSAAGTTFESSKLVINKLPAKNLTLLHDGQKVLQKPFNKTELGKFKVDLLPNVTGLKDAVIADKLNELTKDIDVMEKLTKTEALIIPKPNKTEILAKLDAFKDAVAAQINATLHKKDPAPEPPV